MKKEFAFKNIEVESIRENFFKAMAKDWMLLCAGDIQSYNMMTAAWATYGILWNKPVAISYVRPERHTFQFTEKNSFFTINFFPEKYKYVLDLCGSRSGRDINKMKIEGLHPVQTKQGNVIFNEASLAIECEKKYYDDIKPGNFLDPSIKNLYLSNDYHRFYIGEIINAWVPD